MNTKKLNYNISNGIYFKQEITSKNIEPGSEVPKEKIVPGVVHQNDEKGTTIRDGNKVFRIFKGCNKFSINGRTYNINNRRIWDIAYSGKILFLAAAGKVYAVNQRNGKVIRKYPNFVNPKELRFDRKTGTLVVKDRNKTIAMNFTSKRAGPYTSDDTYSHRWMHGLRRTCYLVWDILKKVPTELKLGIAVVWEAKFLVGILGLVSISGLGGASIGSIIAETYALTGMLHGAALISGFALGAIAMAGFLFLALTATAVALSAEHTLVQY